MSGEVQTSKTTGVSGLVFVGCLLIGLAVGILTGEMAVVLLAALGFGFLGMAIVRLATRAW